MTARVTMTTACGGLLKDLNSDMSDLVKQAIAASARAIPSCLTFISLCSIDCEKSAPRVDIEASAHRSLMGGGFSSHTNSLALPLLDLPCNFLSNFSVAESLASSINL